MADHDEEQSYAAALEQAPAGTTPGGGLHQTPHTRGVTAKTVRCLMQRK